MRTKTKTTVASAAINQAWEDVFSAARAEDAEQLKRDGWRHTHEIAKATKREVQATNLQMMKACSRGEFEKKTARILFSGKTRLMNFYRPLKK
jgi:hypothetical protein